MLVGVDANARAIVVSIVDRELTLSDWPGETPRIVIPSDAIRASDSWGRLEQRDTDKRLDRLRHSKLRRWAIADVGGVEWWYRGQGGEGGRDGEEEKGRGRSKASLYGARRKQDAEAPTQEKRGRTRANDGRHAT